MEQAARAGGGAAADGANSYTFKSADILFDIPIGSSRMQIIPFQTLLFPTYATFTNFKWINTYLPMIVPAFFGFGLKGGLFVFLSNQYMLGIPKEMEEAAKIDGCSFVGTFSGSYCRSRSRLCWCSVCCRWYGTGTM